MKDKKKLWIRVSIVSSIVIIFIIIPLIIALTSSYTVILKDNSSMYYNARVIMLAGDALVCFKDSAGYKNKKNAQAISDFDYNLSILSMKDILYMEIVPDADDSTGDKDDGQGIRYLGKFRVDLSGIMGYLYLSKKRGKLYGTLQFPQWANGVYEPLKSLWISKGKIGFIRSVDSSEEAKRVGVNTYFVQEFYGVYKRKGNIIEGYYTKRGAKNMWRALRI